MKANPWELIKAHYATYQDARDGRTLLRDHAVFDGIPVLVLIACLLIGTSLPVYACAGLLTVTGLLGAFLFGVMLQVAERAMEWSDQPPEQSADTSRQAIFLGQIAANAGYAALICLLTAAVFVAATLTKNQPLEILSAVGLALAVHLVLVLLMVMVRVYALIEERLVGIRTGATITELPRRRAG